MSTIVDRHRARWASVALGMTFVVLATGCGGDDDPYGRLTDLEISYVIPGSGQWAIGDPCAEADCSGEIDSGQLGDASWVVVDVVTVVEGTAGEERTIRISMDIEGVVRGAEDPASFEGSAWGQDVGWASEALAAGHELWAATECPGLTDEYVCHFVAIDEHGRFAGIGYGMGLLFTTPLAREAAHRGALSGRQFLEDHL